MQPLVLSPGAMVGGEKLAPASLSEMSTVPALKALEGFALVREKLDQVAAVTAAAARPTATSERRSLRARLISSSVHRSGASRRRSAPESRTWGPRLEDGLACMGETGRAGGRRPRRGTAAALPWSQERRARYWLRASQTNECVPVESELVTPLALLSSARVAWIL